METSALTTGAPAKTSDITTAGVPRAPKARSTPKAPTAPAMPAASDQPTARPGIPQSAPRRISSAPGASTAVKR